MRSACSHPVCGCDDRERPYDDCRPALAERRLSVLAALTIALGASALMWASLIWFVFKITAIR